MIRRCSSRCRTLLAATIVCAPLAHGALAATGPGQPLSLEELDAVHAAGLSDELLHPGQNGNKSEQGQNPYAAELLLSQATARDRQQALDQLRLAAGAAQAGVGAVQNLSTVALLPAAPVLAIPALAMPFPLFMAPPLPPQQPGGKH